jgi:hypothetical protein
LRLLVAGRRHDAQLVADRLPLIQGPDECPQIVQFIGLGLQLVLLFPRLMRSGPDRVADLRDGGVGEMLLDLAVELAEVCGAGVRLSW